MNLPRVYTLCIKGKLLDCSAPQLACSVYESIQNCGVVFNEFSIIDKKCKARSFSAYDEFRSSLNEELDFFAFSYKVKHNGKMQWINELRIMGGKKRLIINVITDYKKQKILEEKEITQLLQVLKKIGVNIFSCFGFFMNGHNDASLFGIGIVTPQLSDEEVRTIQSLRSFDELENRIYDIFWFFVAPKRILCEQTTNELLAILDSISARYTQDKEYIYITLPVSFNVAASDSESIRPYIEELRAWFKKNDKLVYNSELKVIKRLPYDETRGF